MKTERSVGEREWMGGGGADKVYSGGKRNGWIDGEYL